MGFFSFLVLLAIAYLLWRVTDQLPDLIFRMSEIQRDVAEIRRAQAGGGSGDQGTAPSAPASTASAGNTGTGDDTAGATDDTSRAEDDASG